MSFPNDLIKAAKLAKEKRSANAPTVISTFAGGGGSSLGYQMAGFNELLAIEIENDAVKTLKENFPTLNIYHGDIASLSVKEILEGIKLKQGELDILDGSPPCQGFSMTGKREMSDERNNLFKEFIRLLRGLEPKVFVMENVSGMVKGKMKLIFVEILKELKAAGYNVSARILNTKYYGVPQSRERLIFIGIRKDLAIPPSHPKPKTQAITFREATEGIKDYKDRTVLDFVLKYGNLNLKDWSTDPKIYKRIKGNTAGAFSLQWADWNKIIGTIVKSEIHSSGIMHPNKERYLNLYELKRCGSFPDDYKFTNRKLGVERIGNSVPPLFMKAIAEHIKKEILSKC